MPRFAGGVDILFPTLTAELWSAFYQPTWQYMKFSVVETNVVEGGSTVGRFRVLRNVTAPVAITESVNVTGQARSASLTQADHTLPATFFMTLASNALSADITFTAGTDGIMEGWESIVFTPVLGNVEIVFDYGARFMAFARENVANPELLPQGDFDADGLGDRWELAHGLDPFTPGEALLDPDRDGLTTEDEYRSNTNPKSADSDGDGENDFMDLNRPANEEEFVEIRLLTRDTGKVNNGQNCAVCHTTQLRVGDFSHASSERGVLADKSYFFRKGSNYPIHLSELVQNLPPATGNGSNPTTTATYTANILPLTNQPRAFVVQDPQTKLGTNRPWSNFPTDPSVAIGSLVVPKIEVTFTNLSGNTPLDANTNWGGGVRVFPDALNPNDSIGRNRVRVRVRTIPPLPQEVVRLKWYDVDDPSPNDHAYVVDAGDATGEKGNDNRGPSLGVLLSQTTLQLNSQGEASTDFTPSMQPGDNFRIAAVLDTPSAQAHLDQLQVTNANAPLYLTANTNGVPGFVGSLSPMLTVWRKLHLEFDSMEAPPATGPQALSLQGRIISLTNNYPSQGRCQVRLLHTNVFDLVGFGDIGKIVIPGVNSYSVRKSSFRSSGPRGTSTLELTNVLPTSVIGLTATIYDDDDRYLQDDLLYRSVVNLKAPPLPAQTNGAGFLQSQQRKFGRAYIQLVDANVLGWNSSQTIPFKRNAPSSVEFFGVVSSDFDIGNLQLKGTDRPEFWTFSVVFGYQPARNEDNDPNGEVATGGETPKELLNNRPYGFSVVWMESIRERQFVGFPPAGFNNEGSAETHRTSYIDDLYGLISHEIGHAPGRQRPWNDHAEGEVMKRGALDIKTSDFAPATIKRFRTAISWTQ